MFQTLEKQKLKWKIRQQAMLSVFQNKIKYKNKTITFYDDKNSVEVAYDSENKQILYNHDKNSMNCVNYR